MYKELHHPLIQSLVNTLRDNTIDIQKCNNMEWGKAIQHVKMIIAKIDEKLNEDKFILPGLGDAGDRAYNTR